MVYIMYLYKESKKLIIIRSSGRHHQGQEQKDAIPIKEYSSIAYMQKSHPLLAIGLMYQFWDNPI